MPEYSTAQEALLAKKDQLQFLNPEHGSFADEVQQAIQQLYSLQNMYGDNLYAPVAPNAVQETLDAGALESLTHCMMEMSILKRMHGGP